MWWTALIKILNFAGLMALLTAADGLELYPALALNSVYCAMTSSQTSGYLAVQSVWYIFAQVKAQYILQD